MATFPALVPTAIPLTPGRWGGTQIPNLAGGITPVRHSSTEAGRGLSLSFILTRTELYQLRDHYLGQLSNMDGFTFTTTTIPASYTPPGSWWFYTGPPQITDQQSDYFPVDIEVQSEPMPIFTMAGGAFHVRPRLAIGSPTALLPGAALTASPALSAGAITSAITGVGFTVASSLTSGAVTGFTPGGTFNVATGEADALFSQVQLLLHCNDNFTDTSSAGRTVVNTGSVQFSSAYSVAGSSAYVPSGSRYLSVTGGIDIPSNTPATLEAWIRLTSVASVGIFGDGLTGNGQLLGVVNGQLSCYWNGNEMYGGTINANQGYHVAVTRDSSNIVRLFVDGALVATAGSANSQALRLDRILSAPYRGDFPGYADEIRVTVGATGCRYTSAYTVSGNPFPDSQYNAIRLTPGSPA